MGPHKGKWSKCANYAVPLFLYILLTSPIPFLETNKHLKLRGRNLNYTGLPCLGDELPPFFTPPFFSISFIGMPLVEDLKLKSEV